jgi:hypothetical protein
MYKQVLEHINGVEIYPVISLLIFFVFFIALIIWMIKADKNYISRMSTLPLDIGENFGYGQNENFNGEQNKHSEEVKK